MSTTQFLVFDPFDNPMHLSKVGNWVITFLSPREQLEHIQLAITYVLPRQISEQLQTRRIVILQTQQETHWQIQYIECYDSQQQKEITLDPHDPLAQQALQQLCHEFGKYEVKIELS